MTLAWARRHILPHVLINGHKEASQDIREPAYAIPESHMSSVNDGNQKTCKMDEEKKHIEKANGLAVHKERTEDRESYRENEKKDQTRCQFLVEKISVCNVKKLAPNLRKQDLSLKHSTSEDNHLDIKCIQMGRGKKEERKGERKLEK